MPDRKVKKRRRTDDDHDAGDAGPDTSKPTAVFQPSKGRPYTSSIALPGSIIANAVTHDQKTALAGQIARACAVFCVDEVVVFDDGQAETRPAERGGYTAFADPNFFLYRLLSYVETPPHLRKALFPMHPDLRTAGALPSLDMPHHLRGDEWCPYREGLAVRAAADGRHGAMVDCGLAEHVFVPVELEPGTRVTVKLGGEGRDEGEAVSPDAPREEAGYYWGFRVRRTASLGGVFTECPYDGGYDWSVGTSERGGPVAEARGGPAWMHRIVVFGGVAGLEAALAADDELRDTGVRDVGDLFDRWVNLVPGQGSRTIRTEEAVWVGLAGLWSMMETRAGHMA